MTLLNQVRIRNYSFLKGKGGAGADPGIYVLASRHWTGFYMYLKDSNDCQKM